PRVSPACEDVEVPSRPIEISGFGIDVHEVTQRRYRAYLDATHVPPPPYDWTPDATPGLPVVYVTYEEARAYCRWAGGDLPTESQGELAGRGPGAARTDPWGDREPACGKVNMGGCASRGGPVGSFAGDVSPFGVMDLGGNVAEWSRDWYASASARPWHS